MTHSLRPHHLAGPAWPLHSRAWHRTLPPAVAGSHLLGKGDGAVWAESRHTDPFGSNTHWSVGSGWHSRSWHISGGKEPSPDGGARTHVALVQERHNRSVELEKSNIRILTKKLQYHGSSVWHGPGGSPAMLEEQHVTTKLAASSWSTSACDYGSSGTPQPQQQL